MTDNRAQFRRDEMTDKALAKAVEKWPDLKESERYRRIIEQWLLNQDAGTSKTQKMADIDLKLTEHSKALLELTQNSLSVVERVFKLEQLVKSIYDIVLEMKGQVQEHGYE